MWIEEFERLHPHIKIEYDGTGGMNDAIAVSLAAGTGPDILEIYGDRGQSLSHAGAFLDLRPYVERDFTAEDVADFFPALWEASILKFGTYAGSQMSIPRYTTTTAFYFNSDLFAEAGLPTPIQLSQTDDWTWETLRDSAQRLTVGDGQGGVARRGLMLQSINGDRFVQWVQAAGGDIFDPADPTRFVGDGPEAVLGGSFLQSLVWADGSTALSDRQLFSQGRAAMLDEGMHVLFDVIEPEIAGGFEWDVVQRPVGPGGQAAYASYDAFAIAATTEHPEEAWEFVKFLTSKEGQEISIQTQGLPPSRRSAMPAFLDLDPDRNLHAFTANAMVARAPLTTRISGDVSAIISRMNSGISASIVTNEKSFQQAIQEVKSQIEALIAR